jgi:hypothetical protein
MNAKLVVGGIVALGLVVALQLLRRTNPPGETPAAAPAPAPVAEAVADDDTRGAADEPAASPSASPQSPAAVGREPEPERAPLPGETPATPMADLLRDRQQPLPPEMVAMEQAFGVESVDTAWSDGAEADILGRFAQRAGLKLIDLQVECRSTMCRLQMAQPTPQADSQPLPDLLRSLDLQPRFLMSIIDSYGNLKSVAYLPRATPEGTQQL